MGLSFVAQMDDMDDMRATLSQSIEGAGSSAATRLFRIVLAGLGLLVLATACHSGDTDSNAKSDSSHGDGGTAATAEHASDFEWPEDPKHPELTLEIADFRDADGQDHSGSIRIELMPELAPETVARIAQLATNAYYDGTTFHRVIPGFMIQGGDPNSRDRNPDNDGLGRAAEPVIDEFSDAPFVRGVVGIASKGREGSAGNQLFIMQGDDRTLDGKYTVVGRVVSGMDLVDAITRVETDRNGRWGPKNRPIENVVMTRVSVDGALGETATGSLAARGPEEESVD
jgi:cyclophilin family peptidyl-prolyl cis-trans isomerase